VVKSSTLVLCTLCAAALSTLGATSLPALAQDGDQSSAQDTSRVQRAPNAQKPGDPRFTTEFKNEPPRPTNVVDDGQYVGENGVIDGSNLKQFLNSGPTIDATAMEEASIPADNFVQMPDVAPKPGKWKKKKGLFGAIARGWAQTCNMLGYNCGDDDVGPDASLSSDLPQAVRDAYGAYNPNKQ